MKLSATDFVLDLPEEFKNVVSITVVSVQVPNSNYTFVVVMEQMNLQYFLIFQKSRRYQTS